MEDQIGALGLVLNALVLFNTRYMDAAVTQLREDGFEVRDEDVARLSPFVRHHINMPGAGTPSSSPTCPAACVRCEIRTPPNDRAPRRSADGGHRGAAVVAVLPGGRCSSGCLRVRGVCWPAVCCVGGFGL
jgi:hypothetical protein